MGELINNIIQSGGGPGGAMMGGGGPPMGGGGGGGGFNPMGGGGSATIEFMIPGTKVGIIIGKGGETIKQLQEEFGCKMMVVQESNQPSQQDKMLKISGDASACSAA